MLIALIIFQADKSEKLDLFLSFKLLYLFKVNHEQAWIKVNLTDKVTVGQWYKILHQPSPASLLNTPDALMLYTFTPWCLYMQSRSLSISFLLDKIT